MTSNAFALVAALMALSDAPVRAAVDQLRRALTVCERCAVREECDAWADAHSERGVWGGVAESARRERRRDAA